MLPTRVDAHTGTPQTLTAILRSCWESGQYLSSSEQRIMPNDRTGLNGRENATIFSLLPSSASAPISSALMALLKLRRRPAPSRLRNSG